MLRWSVPLYWILLTFHVSLCRQRCWNRYYTVRKESKYSTIPP